MNQRPSQLTRFRVMAAMALAVLAIYLVVLFNTQVVHHEEYLAKSIQTITRMENVEASRGIITELLTRKVLSGEITSLSPLMKGIRSSNNVVRIPIMSILYHTFGPTRAPRGCNMAFWRNDLIRVNGYDEDFKGWGFEDAELCIRLNNSEIHQRCMKFRGVAFHLHHNQAERSGCNSNEQRYKDSIRCHRTRCEKGLDRHLTPKISYEIGRGSAIVIGG